MLKVQRLNMDNSWIIHLENTKILVDPWLFGAEVDYFPWFNKQWHRTPPIQPEILPDYDFCIITQKYPDHFHKETLSVIQPSKIIGPKSIRRYVKRLLPKSTFIGFDEDLSNVFGSGIDIKHIPTKRKIDPIYDALLVKGKEKKVFIATHGFSLAIDQKDAVESSLPVDLLITPLNTYKLPAVLGGYVSPGLKSVEELVQTIEPKFIAATHDEDKHAKGLVSKFAKITWAPKQADLKTNPILGDKFLDIHDYQIHEL